MQRAQSILSLETSTTEDELLDVLRKLTVASLKTLCKEAFVKVSGNKAELIGRLVTHWERKCTGSDSLARPCGSRSGAATALGVADLPVLAEIRTWSKDLSSLKDFTFMQLYHYHVKSRDKTFDKDSLKAFKSLIAYKYFSDNLVQNVWLNEVEGKDMVIVRGYCHSSLKAKTTYTVYVILQSTGDVLGAQCKCIVGKGEACSHVAALLFYIEDIKRREGPLPSDKTVTDQLQQWHVPPQRTVTPQPLSKMEFHKAAYGKELHTAKHPDTTQLPSHHDQASLTQFVEKVSQIYPESGLMHFWTGPEMEEGKDSSETTGQLY